jgi:uroporphyrinogen III methyltransferase/synthase
MKPPSLIIVGDVVSLRDKINWFEKRVLFGKRMIVTRTREQASELIAGLSEEGADCLEYATINIKPCAQTPELDAAVENMAQFDWLIFSSINSVKYFFQRLSALGLDSRSLKGLLIAAVGTTTANILKTYGIQADLIPEKFTGDSLAEKLITLGVDGSQILIPRAVKAREVLAARLQNAGAKVTIAPIYKNTMADDKKDALKQELASGTVDLITFTSSSTVKNFITMLDTDKQEEIKKMLTGIKIAAIGPVTAKTVRDYGLTVDIMPEQYTIQKMVQAVIDFYRC